MLEAAYGNVYGAPPAEIVEIAPDAIQFSPLFPGARDLADVPPGSLDGLVMLAPPGTVERRHEIALALRALRPGAPLVAHKLRLRGLPLRCTEDDVRDFLGAAHAGRVAAWDAGGYCGGVMLLRGADGWPTGEALVKFDGRESAARALQHADRRHLGRRLVRADFEVDPMLRNRGRVIVAGLDRATTPRDLITFFRGWGMLSDEQTGPHLITDDDGRQTGEAVLEFASEAAATALVTRFDFHRRLRGRLVVARLALPLMWNEVAETWDPPGQRTLILNCAEAAAEAGALSSTDSAHLEYSSLNRQSFALAVDFDDKLA